MSENNPVKELTLKELIVIIQTWVKYLLSKWAIILIAGIFGGILGYFYSRTESPIYTAVTTFVLEDGESGNGLGQVAGLVALAGVDISGGSSSLFQGDNLFVLYKSRAMIEQALLSSTPLDTGELLINKYIEFNNLSGDDENGQRLSKIDFKKEAKTFDPQTLRFRDSILGEITESIVRNNLVIDKIDKKSSIIKVEIKAKNEEFAKSFNQVLVNTVNNFYVKTKTKKSLDNIEILQHKTDSVRAVMNGSINTAAAAFDATPNLNPTRQAQRTIPINRSQFSTETNKVILGQLVQNLEVSKLSLMKEAPLIQVIDVPISPLVKEEIRKSRYIAGGFFLLLFAAVAFLMIIRVYKNIMTEVSSS